MKLTRDNLQAARVSDFVDYERDYKTDNSGRLSTSEYFELILQEYETTHGKILDYLKPGRSV